MASEPVMRLSEHVQNQSATLVAVAVCAQGGGGYHGLRIFDVAGDGTLSVRTGAAATMAKAPSDVDFSADGRNVYVAAGDQLVVFQRDTTTGVLTQLQCFGVAPCSPV